MLRIDVHIIEHIIGRQAEEIESLSVVEAGKRELRDEIRRAIKYCICSNEKSELDLLVK